MIERCNEHMDETIACSSRNHQQDVSLVMLWKQMHDHTEMFDALHELLQQANIVSPMGLASHIHRRRFQKVCEQAKYAPSMSLNTLFETCGVPLALGFVAGLPTMSAVMVLSKKFKLSVQSAMRSVSEQYPRKMYVCGGYDGVKVLRSVSCFSPVTGLWEAAPAMMQARRSCCCGVVGSKLYACGGFDGPHVLEGVERFDIHGGYWEMVAPMRTARGGAAAAVLNERLYVCGGNESPNTWEVLNSVECYNPGRERDTMRTLGGWESIPLMTHHRGVPAAAALGGMLYVCGGVNHNGSHTLSSAERYDPAVGKWSELPPMTERRVGAVAAAIALKMFVCGGQESRRVELASVECFDHQLGTWESITRMHCIRVYAAGSSTGGCVYIFGGHSAETQQSSSVERFDPIAGTWTLLSPMAQPLSGGSAAAFSPPLAASFPRPRYESPTRHSRVQSASNMIRRGFAIDLSQEGHNLGARSNSPHRIETMGSGGSSAARQPPPSLPTAGEPNPSPPAVSSSVVPPTDQAPVLHQVQSHAIMATDAAPVLRQVHSHPSIAETLGEGSDTHTDGPPSPRLSPPDNRAPAGDQSGHRWHIPGLGSRPGTPLFRVSSPRGWAHSRAEHARPGSSADDRTRTPEDQFFEPPTTNTLGFWARPQRRRRPVQ